MIVPIRAVHWVIAVPLVVSCQVYQGNREPLSTVLLPMDEREEVRVLVNVARDADFAIEGELPRWIHRIVDGTAVGFDVKPGCDVVTGGVREVLVRVHAKGYDEPSTLTLLVKDDTSAPCLGEVTTWLSTAPCDDGTLPTAGLLALPVRSDGDHLCVRIVSADPTNRPIAQARISFLPASRGFSDPVAVPDGDDVLRYAVPIGGRGAVPDLDWLWGQFSVTTAFDAGTDAVKVAHSETRTLTIGGPGDIGIEVGVPTAAPVAAPAPHVPREFGTSVVPITVHRFPDTRGCDLTAAHPRSNMDDVEATCDADHAVVLSRIGDNEVPPCTPISCDVDPVDAYHPRFLLRYMPEIDSASTMSIPLDVRWRGDAEAATTAMASVTSIESRAENLDCLADLIEIECLYVGGVPTVVATTLGGTCIHPLDQWRRREAGAVVIGGTAPVRIFPVSRSVIVNNVEQIQPAIYGIQGGAVVALTRDPDLTWRWAAVPGFPSLGPRVVALRSAASSTHDWLAVLDDSSASRRLRFFNLANGEEVVPVAPANAYEDGELGAARFGTGGDGLVIVTSAAAARNPSVHAYRIAWKQGVPVSVVKHGQDETEDLPLGDAKSIAMRTRDDTDQILVAFGTEQVRYGVAIFDILPGGIQLAAEEGGSSVASTLDGHALIASDSDVRIDGPSLTDLDLDPIAPAPFLLYGTMVAACHDDGNVARGFVVRTDDEELRAAQFGIIADPP